jgi:hypothetical protein
LHCRCCCTCSFAASDAPEMPQWLSFTLLLSHRAPSI